MTQIYPLRLALAGASGRMGRTLIATLREAGIAPYWELINALSASTPEVDGIFCTADRDQAFTDAKVVIDFSHRSQTVANLEAAARLGIPCLIGTTALSNQAKTAFIEASKHVAVMYAPNASDGFAVLSGLVAKASAALDNSWDIEILDFHHADKHDAPSGSARLLADVAKIARREEAPNRPPLEVELKCDRQGPRKRGTIGFASLRGGTTAGEHRVIFAGPGERLEIHHIVHDRALYARGALAIAHRLAFAPPGRHDMASLLALPPEHSPPPLD